MIRTEIEELVRLGSFPRSEDVQPVLIERQQKLLGTILPPVSAEEAKELATLFGADDYFGLAWTVLHLIESGPQWPLTECLAKGSNEWIIKLSKRSKD